MLPVAEELGAASHITVPAANSAERQRARYDEGASFREIYGDLVVRQEEPVHG